MKDIAKILVIFFLLISSQLYSQTFSGGTGYNNEFDNYLEDYLDYEGKSFQIIKQELFTYPETAYAFMIEGLDITVNPKYLGNNFALMKFAHDLNGNIILTGICPRSIVSDSSYMFVAKLNENGTLLWTKLFEKNGDSLSLFIDDANFIYIHDSNFLYKLNSDGIILWQKNSSGTIKFLDNFFYKIQCGNVIEHFDPSYLCDSIILEKIDTSGIIIYQCPLNISLGKYSLSANYSFNIANGKIFLSNSFWGKINVDPTNTNLVFENNRWEPNGPKGSSLPAYNNYLAIYDLQGNLKISCSKEQLMKFDNVCADSFGNIYLSGLISNESDYAINPDTNFIVEKKTNEISFLAKYSDDFNCLWVRKLKGNIKYIGTSTYHNLEIEKLYVAGEYEGNICLDFNYPSSVTFMSTKQGIFVAEYDNLNVNPKTTSVLDIKQSNSFKVFPNPCTGLLNLYLNGNSNFSVEIYNQNGVLKFLNSNFDQDIDPIDMSGFENGLYFLKLKDNNEVMVKKILLLKDNNR